MEPGAEFNDPCRPLPTQDILRLHDSAAAGLMILLQLLSQGLNILRIPPRFQKIVPRYMDDIAGWGNTHCEANTTLKDYITSQQPYFFARPKFSSLIIMLFNIKKKERKNT